MKLSIVIPTYNRSDLLKYTLESLFEQILCSDGTVEIIVVDDGSTDDTKKICDSYRYLKYFFQEDLGFRAAKARNIGAAISRGEYIAFIDSGLVCHENFVERMLDQIDNNTASIFIGSIYAFNKENEISRIMNDSGYRLNDAVIDKFNKVGIIDMRDSRYKTLGTDLSDRKSWPVLGDISWSGNICISRKAFYSAGMFDEDFNSWGGEDIDLGIRLQDCGFIFHLAKNCFTVHIPHESKYSEDTCLIKERELMKKHHKINYVKFFELARIAGEDINTYIITNSL